METLYEYMASCPDCNNKETVYGIYRFGDKNIRIRFRNFERFLKIDINSHGCIVIEYNCERCGNSIEVTMPTDELNDELKNYSQK